MNKLLSLIYGRDTRGIQIISVIVSLSWLSMLLLNHTLDTNINLPIHLTDDILSINLIMFLSIIFSLLGFICKQYRHQLYKSMGLLISSLVQAVIASAYISKYPPFEPMLIVCLVLSLWFLGAVLYICNLEGLNECTRN